MVVKQPRLHNTILRAYFNKQYILNKFLSAVIDPLQAHSNSKLKLLRMLNILDLASGICK